MKTISVLLSSSQHFRNTGMFSVEWAAYEFFRKNFPDCKLTFYVPHLSPESEYPAEYEMRVPYRTYKQLDDHAVDEIWSADLIVFWSDFFHTRHYIDQYLTNYTDVDLDLFYQAYFLEGAPEEVLIKAIGFGNSLMFFSDFGKPHDRYSKAFHRLYKIMPISMPRDTVSYENLVKFRSENLCHGCIAQGIDPAMLIPEMIFNPANRAKNIGLFIGRRTEINSSHLKAIKDFAKEVGGKICWIDWMRNTESLLIRAIKNPRQALNLFRHIILGIRYRELWHTENPLFHFYRYDMIITDTYHLAVNAVRCNIPVFCIGTGEVIYGKNALDLHDKKKEVLMSMFGLSNNYGVPTIKKLKLAQNNKPHNQATFSHTQQIKNILRYECGRILNVSV
jgi:hypothetical protein